MPPVPAGTPVTLVNANSPLIAYMGRFDLKTPGRARFSWPGSAITASFTGQSITALLSDDGQPYYNGAPVHSLFNVTIDGQPPQVLTLKAGVSSYPLATGLPAGPHTVTLSKRTESNVGVCLFTGLQVSPEGNFLPPPPRPVRTMEFVGDSGVSGYGADANVSRANMCGFTPATESADLSYAKLLGTTFNAYTVNVSFAGKGITRNLADADNVKMLPVLYGRIIPDDQSEIYDFSQYTPDVVVIDAGGNDFVGPSGSGMPPDRATFVTAYLSLIAQARAHAPNAVIFCVVSTDGFGTDRTYLEDYLNGAGGVVAASGDPKVRYIDLPAYDPSVGYGCDYHPNAAGHRRTAQYMAGIIGPALHWN
jgi:lysophospholipase L1-like esterase